ncbi:MAG: SdiA-regulated domain-containing protein [Gemmatimonadetes bacterium]|nr:SdiA-regulated domain-containing protein [Gemmatimonadota bacterium]
MGLALATFAAAWLVVVPAGAAGTQSGALARYDLGRDRGAQAKLPRELIEISGLAVIGDRVFGHGDERAIVFRVETTSGAASLAFAPGQRGVRGDFEGVAFAEGLMHLATSTGVLVAFRVDSAGEGVPYETWQGLAERNCEVEGLDYDAESKSLLLACKTTRGKALEDRLVVFAWSVVRRVADSAPRFSIPFADIARAGGGRDFHPSGIAVHPVTRTIFVLAGRQKRILELSRDGRVLDARELPGRNHAQPEGIAFLADGTMLIADEGAGGRATVTRYPMGGAQ